MAEYLTLLAAEMVFVSDDGSERLPVVSAVDDAGEECAIEAAVWCVAGPDKDGLFAQIDMSKQPMMH